jgi:hypothetical protein
MAETYTVAQNSDQQWVVSVEGAEIIICAHKTDAMRAAREAARLLKPDRSDEKRPKPWCSARGSSSTRARHRETG